MGALPGYFEGEGAKREETSRAVKWKPETKEDWFGP